MHTTTETDIRTEPLRVAVLTGSSRDGRFAPAVADWVLTRAGQHPELKSSSIDIGEIELPHAFGAPAPQLDGPRTVLDESDAFVVVTPEYNHSYPGALKNFIDLHHQEWQAKPVGFVSYGGISGGLRAIEHLRTVFAELHAVTVRDTVSFHNPWHRRDSRGLLITDPDEETAADTLFGQLAWWADALRTARAVRPYGR